MSGPLEDLSEVQPGLDIGGVEVREGRVATVGRMEVLRVLPTKKRRSVGPWCFVDLAHPADIAAPPPMEIGPHPHIGLATATWLFSGTVVHSDSLGTEQLIRPGELNLMTSGKGIAHAELGVEAERGIGTDGIMAAQMWLALPESTRHGGSHFEHHADLPEIEIGAARARVIAGTFGGAVSPAQIDHPSVGVDLIFDGTLDLTLTPSFEHCVVPIDRRLKVDDVIVEVGSLALVPAGYETLRLEARDGEVRALLLGGEPFGVEIKMWWNFVARTFDELTEAWRAWKDHDDDRFGPVSSRLARIDAPTPPWIRAKGA